MDLGILVGFFFVLAAFASVLDSYLSDQKVGEIRLGVLAWWEGFQQKDPERLAQRASGEFTHLFDAMYGERHFSWKTFRRSLVFSSFGFLVVVLICEWIAPGYLADMVDELLKGVFLLFIMNLLVDYLSLLETRWVLRRCAASPSGWLPAWLVLDVAASWLIYVFIGLGSFFLLIGLLGEGFEGFYRLFTFDGHIGVLPNFTHIREGTAFFYSTFFTSFLFYLFVLASLLIHLLKPIRFALLPLMGWLSVSPHPIKSFVGIAAGMAFLIEGVRWML